MMAKNDSLLAAFKHGQFIHANGLLSLLMQANAGVALGIKGMDGRYLMANSAMELVIGLGAAQIIGQTDADIFRLTPDEPLLRADQRILKGEPTASGEVFISNNQIARHFLWLKFPVLDQDGKTISIGLVVLDNDQQQAIARMQQSLEIQQRANHELMATVTELEHMASTDKLTGAWNRRRLEDTVNNEMARLKRYGHPLSQLVIDIDFFKAVNDQYGHSTGDQVLATLASLLRANIRPSDFLARWGGEEFVVICPNTTLPTACLIAERLRAQAADTIFPLCGNVTVSIGVAECLPDETWEQWFERADAAQYRAKAQGRNRVESAPETPRHVGAGENVSANFVQLVWRTAYESGNDIIDREHRGLFADADDLLTAILGARPEDEVSAAVDKLLTDVVQHFKDEEAIFIAAGYPSAEAHAALHRELVSHAYKLADQFRAGTLGIGELFAFLAKDVVAKHMLSADREFFPYLAQ